MEVEELRLAIIHHIVTQLDDVGKTRVQKLCYFLQEALNVPTQYAFKMHHYGPYAEAVETDIARLKLAGYVNIEADLQGYGFHIPSIDEPLEEWNHYIESFGDAIRKILSVWGSRQTNELELAASIHFVQKLLPGIEPDEMLKRVKALKPKFGETFIQHQYAELKKSELLT